MDPLQLDGLDLQRMKKRLAEIGERSIHQSRIGMQQQQIGAPLELRGLSGEPLGWPCVVLIAERDQVALARTHGLLEILRHAQWRRVLQHVQRHRGPRMYGIAFLDHPAGDLDAAIGRGVV